MSAPDGLAGVVRLSAWVARRDDECGTGESIGDGSLPRRTIERGAPECGEEETARAIAVRSLGRRAASRKELDRALERRDVASDTRDAVLDRLEREGLIDDARLALDAADRLRERKHLGHRGVAAELRRRGLDPGALPDRDRDDELDRAVEAAAERRRRMGTCDVDTIERRLAGWLQRRGFDGSVVRAAIEQTRPGSP